MLFLTLLAAVAAAPAAATASAPAPASTCGAELELRCDHVRTNHTECLRCALEVGKTHNCTTKEEAEFCHAAPVPHHGSGIPWTNQDMGGPCPITYPFTNETGFCLSVGKQRAIVELETGQDGPGIACAKLPWRRDDDPAEVGVYVLGGMQGMATPAISDGNATVGEVCFETLAGIRTYAVYYLPFGWSFDGGSGSYHSHFLAPSSVVPPALKLAGKDQLSGKTARFVGFESITSFDERSPMEFMASKAEVAAVEAAAGGLEYLTWVSLVKNTTYQTPRRPRLPVAVARTSPNTTVSVSVTARQPSAVVQVLLYAVGKGFDAVAVAYPAAATASAATRWTCLQTEGTDFYGRPMQPPPVASRKGEVTHLLFIVEASASSLAGLADRCRDEGVAAGGSVTQQDRIKITPAGMQSTILTANVAMVCPIGAASDAGNGGAASPDDSDDIWRLSRMAWLNSKIGQEPSVVTRPYGPIERRPSRHGIGRLDVRGRSIEISLDTGLPAAITSNGRAVLADPIAFAVETAASDLTDAASMPAAWVPDESAVEISFGPGNASATWSVVSHHAQTGLRQRLDARLDFDGHVDYGITLTASGGASSGSVHITKASLVASIPAALAKYADGAGAANNGGYFPTGNASALDWSWAAPQPTPGHLQPAGDPVKSGGWRFWAGDVDAGLFVKLKGTELDWNSGEGGAVAPASWSNAGKGGIKVTEDGPNATSDTSVEFEAFSGARSLAPGASVTFNFSLLATPVKGDYQHTDEGKREHYVESRHYHVPYGEWDPINTTEAEGLGANVVILHQSNRLNPYINYPFQPTIITALKEYINGFAKIGVTVKMYYTISQISNHAIELFALAGLNGEVLLRNTSDAPPGPRLGGMDGTLMGNEWLEEHMTTGYEGEWFTKNRDNDEDAAIKDNTTSRFMNYYIEGQQWLFESVGVGGLYYDGFVAERSVQRRVRRMSHVAAAKKSATLQKASAGMEPRAAGGHHAPPRFDIHGRAFQNTELLPYVDSMWTCEGIDFTRDPGYWLISISALPFGTFGEMLGGDRVPPVPGTFCGENCANRFRGMLYGMTNRAGWVGFDPNDNQHLWNLWDDFGIERAHMYGYWNKSTAVKVHAVHAVDADPPNNDPPPGEDGPVLATAYVRPGNATLVAIASWSTKDQLVRLGVDWAKLGLVRSNGTVVAPLIPSFNAFNTTKGFHRDAEIMIPALKGLLLLLSH